MFAFHHQCFVDAKFARKIFIFNLCHLHSFSFDFSVEHMHFTLLSLQHKCFADAYFQLSLTSEKLGKETNLFGYNVQQIEGDFKYWLVPLRDAFKKKLRDYLGIFPNIGGAGSPQSQNFCDLTK